MKSTVLKFTKSDGLTPKQKAAIPALVGSRSIEEGCRQAHISKSTLYQWLTNPTFQGALEKARETVISESLERLKAAVTGAVEGLVALSEDSEKSIKLRACEKIIDFFHRTRELEDVMKRFERIEESLNEK